MWKNYFLYGDCPQICNPESKEIFHSSGFGWLLVKFRANRSQQSLAAEGGLQIDLFEVLP